jgi:hypothetical protein
MLGWPPFLTALTLARAKLLRVPQFLRPRLQLIGVLQKQVHDCLFKNGPKKIMNHNHCRKISAPPRQSNAAIDPSTPTCCQCPTYLLRIRTLLSRLLSGQDPPELWRLLPLPLNDNDRSILRLLMDVQRCPLPIAVSKKTDHFKLLKYRNPFCDPGPL